MSFSSNDQDLSYWSATSSPGSGWFEGNTPFAFPPDIAFPAPEGFFSSLLSDIPAPPDVTTLNDFPEILDSVMYEGTFPADANLLTGFGPGGNLTTLGENVLNPEASFDFNTYPISVANTTPAIISYVVHHQYICPRCSSQDAEEVRQGLEAATRERKRAEEVYQAFMEFYINITGIKLDRCTQAQEKFLIAKLQYSSLNGGQ